MSIIKLKIQTRKGKSVFCKTFGIKSMTEQFFI